MASKKELSELSELKDTTVTLKSLTPCYSV